MNSSGTSAGDYDLVPAQPNQVPAKKDTVPKSGAPKASDY
jgi:hypothetical protein